MQPPYWTSIQHNLWRIDKNLIAAQKQHVSLGNVSLHAAADWEISTLKKLGQLASKDQFVLLEKSFDLGFLIQSAYSLQILSGQKVCYGDFKRSCYKLAYFQDLSRRVGFQEARQACEIDGGALLSLESEAEQQLIENMLQNLTKSGSGISDGDFWIGLWRSGDGLATSSACPDLYQWADGSISPFRNWYTDEPSCGSEACVVMYHQPTANPGLGGPYLYQWNDDRCNMKHNFICKYGPDNVLEKELGDRAEPDYDIFPTVPAGNPYDTSKPEDQYHVIATETGIIPNLIYVIIPTIPLLLLILVAFGTCCFQMLHKSKGRTKTSPNQSTLWISKTPRKDSSMEV
ncbi:PREDICTED: chondrolectin [Leptosomus discolor]|nr:PREDICTED: chondrolectin [Leptosomus discolor]